MQGSVIHQKSMQTLDVKVGNFMKKYALEFDAKKPREFIESARDLICLQ